MTKKLITILLIIIIIICAIAAPPKIVSQEHNIIKIWSLLIGGFFLLILILCNYKELTIDRKDILILIFIGLAFLSMIFSNDIKTSIIGTSTRYEGILALIAYACIYIASKKFFFSKNMKYVYNIGFYVALIIGIFGILQKYISLKVLDPFFSNKICATFGNSNFFGSFISIVLPIAICSYVLYSSKKGLILSLVMFFNMISSGTRSAWVAFIVITIFGITYLINNKNKEYLKRAIMVFLCFVLIFMYLCNGFGIFKPNINTNLQINRLKSDITQAREVGLNGNMGSGRIEIWMMTLKVIKNNPLLGCGVDNLTNGFIDCCPGELLNFCKKANALLDKAHNEYLQIAATIGIPALIIYLMFIGLILLPKMKNMFNDKWQFIFCITIISYLVQAFFNISTIGVAPLFWMILGLSDNKDIVEK